ncbi:hypothetical protein [Bosea sp. NBC_00550]|nr:hypothetical protein [Bosea sp. NBC_00550]UZF92666.1 hypothetical protein NWE53_00095 [Bosea sp. NBC_00550]
MIGECLDPADEIGSTIAILASHGWIEEVSARPRRVRLVQEASA